MTRMDIASLMLGAVIGIAAGVGHWMATEPVKAQTSVWEPIVVEAAEVVPEKTGLTSGERDILAGIVYAEARGEDAIGKRLIVDTILNRVASDRFPGTIWEVVFQPYQFYTAGMPNPWTIPEDCYAAVDAEVVSTEVLFFRTGWYHGFGTPVMQHGNHYFSK